MTTVLPGRYRHYKGNEYTVLGTAQHSENGEELVVYRQEYGDHGLWVRPKQMFLETVQVAGQVVPRFGYLGSEASPGEKDTNIFADIPANMPKELVQALLTKDGLRIERIVSLGHVSPPGFWYDQGTAEWVLLIQGAARLQFEGEDRPVEMTPGSFINIPAHTRHRVEWTTPNEPTIWLGVRYKES